MERTTLENGTRLTRSPDGEVSVWVPVPRVMVCHASGHLSTDLHAAFRADGVPLIQNDVEWWIFGDWYDLTGYDTDVRHELTKTVSKLRSRIASICVLQRSKVVAMGIAVANLALGGWVRSTTNRAEFDRELEQRIRGAQSTQRSG